MDGRVHGEFLADRSSRCARQGGALVRLDQPRRRGNR
jgi:hypothetical protein